MLIHGNVFCVFSPRDRYRRIGRDGVDCRRPLHRMHEVGWLLFFPPLNILEVTLPNAPPDISRRPFD